MLKIFRHLWIILLVTITSQCHFADPSLCQTTSPDSSKTAVLLFISSGTSSDLKAPVAEIRETTLLNLHNQLSSSGHEVVPAEKFDAVAGHWRIRNDWSISRAFLQHLENDFGTSLLVVVHLRAAQTGLTLISRVLDCKSGQLLAVDILNREFPLIDEVGPSPDSTTFFTTLAQLCHSFELAPRTTSNGPQLMVLPAEGIGCDPFHALVATVSVLQQILKSNDISLPDPGLVSTTLSSSQSHPNRFGPRGRRLLQSEFPSEDLLRLNIITYRNKIQNSASRFFDDDSISDPDRSLGDFDLTLRQIHLQDGLIVLSRSIFAPSTAKSEWFGHSTHSTALQRIDTAANDLWQAFNNNPKDY